MRHLWSQVWIALWWFWSVRESVAVSLSDARIAVSSAKFAVLVAREHCLAEHHRGLVIRAEPNLTAKCQFSRKDWRRRK
jgi:hypothetical protein